ncbi:unnamed protein product [Knipowitschia caucasica]|uniref:SPIN-DOC-like zinc-finger domain-containing protein n=1 Tax=Knipowitschia caucasica TaxID=637954 RepID=A0AAV2KLG3_KNICA
MLTIKDKGDSAGGNNSTGQHRYTPVSEFDDATLAQRREYWRNKKREQRARRSEKKQKSTKPHFNPPAHASSLPSQNGNGPNQLPNNVGSLQLRNQGSGGLAALQCQKQQLRNNFTNAGSITVQCMPPKNGSVSSTSIPHLNSSSSFSVAASRPHVAIQVPLVPKASQHPPAPVLIQPKPLNNIPSVCKSTVQLQAQSALVIQQQHKPTNESPAKAETEEEKAAKRRELWRIRKREQRARLAVRLGKTINKAQPVQRQVTSNGLSLNNLSQSLMQSRSMGNATIPENNAATAFKTQPPFIVVKRPFEPIRNSTSPFHLSGVMRAARPNNFKQKLLKLKPSSMAYLWGIKGIPTADPSDTPEQVVAKRREYWRMKKRIQRAKMPVDVKLRMREKDDLQRRLKSYQKILEDMRRARAQSVMHASETIGGFIKEDGTVTINVPQVSVNTPAQRRIPQDDIGSCSTNPQTSKHIAPLESPVLPFHQSYESCQILTDKPPSPACGSSTHAQGSHLTLTPASPKNRSPTGGCVMKMEVSCKVPSLSKCYLDPGLTEEEKMAKKREYWRVKKREQRAARTMLLRQGHSPARASAVLLRRKAQKLAVPLSKRFPKQFGGIANNNMAYVNEMKQENDLIPAFDLNLNEAICPELKAQMSQTPPPSQADSDPGLSADNQATTLLAVASMKKLLEESLSSVSDCQTQTGIKMEDENENQDIKPDVSLDDVCAPITTHVMLDTEGSEADTKIFEHVSFEQKDVAQITESTIPLSLPNNTPEAQSFLVNPKMEAPDCAEKAGHQHCCSPEPPKLHHPPVDTQTESLDINHFREKCSQVHMTLEQKREYWKLIKRQQRARVKARQKSLSNVGSYRTVQSSSFMLNKRATIKPALLPRPTQSAVAGMPSVLLVSPTVANAGPQGTLRVKSPVCSRDPGYGSTRGIENAHVNISGFPALQPPDNLLSINAQPAQTLGQNFSRTLRSTTVPCPPKPDNAHIIASRGVGSIAPPKRVSGESEEDFHKRKREYWRIKKKEQRARRAFQHKDRGPHPSCSQNQPQYTPQEPQQEQCEAESNEWMNPLVEPEDLINDPDAADGSFSFPSYCLPIEDFPEEVEEEEAAVGCEEGALTTDFWRNHYLMDHDPLNQLLVCMVCGELQYGHSLEGVRGHIEEAHPHTLSLEAGERQRILQAWDEQVFQRERFFTNQLQQNSSSAADAHMN